MLYNYFHVQEFSFFSILILNVIIYVINTYLIFLIIFLFDLKKFINLNNIKFLSSSNYVYFCVILILLSYSGMPPLLGFSGKFLLNIYVLLNSNFLVFFFFFFINIFMIYFYMQNFKYLVKKSNNNNIFILSNVYINLNYKIYSYLNFFIFFLIFGIFFF